MRDAIEGTYKGDYTYCTVNAMGACPYCDQQGICHIADPQDCTSWTFFWTSWEEWEAADEYDELGFDPYAGSYTYDC